MKTGISHVYIEQIQEVCTSHIGYCGHDSFLARHILLKQLYSRVLLHASNIVRYYINDYMN